MSYQLNDITVVLCTANRSKLSKSFIDNFTLNFPETELIVVENSSGKDNFDLLNEFFANIPNVKIFYSSPPGLSRARNYAISRVSTKLVAFTDDDCLPDSNWLEALVTSKLWETADVVGGKVDAILPELFNSKKLPPDLISSLAILDLGSVPRILEASEYLIGANLCFKTKVLINFKFSESLGRVGQSLLSGEESELLNEMSSQGSKIGYEPNAIINHIVSEDRLQSHWFLRRFAWQGVSDSLSEKLNNFEWNRRALDYHAENLGIKKFVDELLADDYKDLEDRAKFARYFIFELLNTESHSPTAPPNMSPFLPVKPNTSHLVFDYEHFHDFLAFTLPSDSITVVTSKYSPYELSTSEFERIVNDLRLKSLSSSKPLHLIILTVDNLLNQSLFPIFQRVFNSYEKVTVCLHRMPNANEKSLLSKLQNRARILVFSKTVEDSLKNEDMNVRYIPIPIRKLNYELNLQTLEESKHTQIAVAGEFRSQKQMQYLTSIIDYLKNRSILVTFKLIGGIKSAEMLRDIAKISELNPGYIHEDNLVRINGEYKVIDSVSYYREIANSDVLLKLQFEEYAAGSAVVADALALGIPIMTLKDTESSRTVEKFFSNLIIDPTNHHTFVSALDLVRKYDKVPNLDFNLKVTEEFVNILLDRG